MKSTKKLMKESGFPELDENSTVLQFLTRRKSEVCRTDKGQVRHDLVNQAKVKLSRMLGYAKMNHENDSHGWESLAPAHIWLHMNICDYI